MKRLAALLLCLTPTLFLAEGESLSLGTIGEQLTAPNHVFGRSLEASDLGQRVVVIWRISEFVDPVAKAEQNGSDLDENGEDSPFEKLKTQGKALQRASKGALRDGRLLVIAVDPQPDDPEMRRYRTDAIRRLKPYFPVYSIDAASQYFGPDGVLRGTIPSITDFAEGDRLTSILKETPEYVPGRIITFRTEDHESVSKLLVEGKNIEQIVIRLRREAGGSGDKAAEAKRMLDAVTSHLDAMAAAIDEDLKAAPSRAAERITIYVKTTPSQGRKYGGALNALRRNPAVKQLSTVRAFLHAANAGKVGRGEMGRNADALTKRLQPLTKSENAAIAAEAATLIAALEPFSAAALAQQQKELRGQIRDRRAREREEAEARERARKEKSKEDDDKPSAKRDTVGSVLANLAGASVVAPLMDELNRLDDATCNYETLRNSYARHAQQGNERGVAAKAVIDSINAQQQNHLNEIRRILKEGKPLDLYSNSNWERILTVNYPSLGHTSEGRLALKMLRDFEIRAIYGVYEDITNGSPAREEGESNEDYAISTTQYLQTKYKTLRKYRGTRSAFGKLCVKQLDGMGFSDAAIEAKLSELDAQLKQQKAAAKEAEKKREEAEKERRRNRD